VLGSDAKDKLFSGQPALGETVRIGGISFEVIGVLSAKMQEGDDNINRVVYIPFSTMGDLRDTRYIDGIWMDYEGIDYDKVEGSIRSVLGASHGFNPKDPRAVFVWNTMKNLNNWQIITMALQVLLTMIGTLTLGIGGVGLMNIMLVSVTQRTREIGVEKALGARRRDILTQFLAEAMAITFAGGLLGVIVAYAISWIIGRRHPSRHLAHASSCFHRDPDRSRPHQRHAARHQSLATRSHRSSALRVATALDSF
jgi:putative ABC transport system permease protein